MKKLRDFEDSDFLLCIIFMFVIALIFGLVFMPRNGYGASFDEASVAASASLPIGADTGAMGGIGTLEEFSSANPAISAIMSEGSMSGTINYGYFQFEKIKLETVSGSVAGKIGSAVLQVGFAHGETPLRFLNPQESFRIKKSDTIDFQFGGKVSNGIFIAGDELYFGVGYAFTEGVQGGVFLVQTSKGIIANEGEIESYSHSGTIGFAYKPIKNVTLGGFGSRIWTTSQLKVNGWKDSETKSFHDVGHLGFSVKAFEGTTLAGDYQHLSFSDSETKIDQYFLGVEQYLIKDTLAVYGGWANGGLTTGIGVYFKNGGLNLSYGHNIAKETKEFFGSCEALMASGYFNF